jgi:hypothetical protein
VKIFLLSIATILVFCSFPVSTKSTIAGFWEFHDTEYNSYVNIYAVDSISIVTQGIDNGCVLWTNYIKGTFSCQTCFSAPWVYPFDTTYDRYSLEADSDSLVIFVIHEDGRTGSMKLERCPQ